MKFDRRIFSNLILIVILIIVGTLITMHQMSIAVRVVFSDDIIAISSKDYCANVAYKDVISLELVDDPDLGRISNGKNRPELKSGLWVNDSWGEYYLCFNPRATNCIVIHLKDNNPVVFNCNTNEKTVASFYEFSSHLPQLSAK